MIPENEIKRECAPQTFTKAAEIVQTPNAFRSSVVNTIDKRGVRTTELTSGVLSSTKKKYYKTSVLFDEGMGEIIDYACACPAAYEYSGMCKHAAALALRYNERPETFMGYTAARKRAMSTSAELAALMVREAAHAGEHDAPNIELLPTFRHYFGNWEVSFRISDGNGTYVLKSIDDFIRRMNDHEFYSYGKKLAFTHKPERLTPHALKLFRFLEIAMEQRRSLSNSTSMSYSNAYGFGNANGHAIHTARDLALTDSEVIALFDLLADDEINIQNDETATTDLDAWITYGKPQGSLVHAHVIDGNPDLHIEIRETEDGFGITPPDEAVVICASDRMYLWRGRKLYRCTPELARIADLLHALNENMGLFVNKQDAPLFCSTLLPLLKDALPVSTPQSLDELVPVPCKLKFYFDANKKTISCHADAVYGNETFPLSLFGVDQQRKTGMRTPTTEGSSAMGQMGKTESRSRIVRDLSLETRGTQLIADFIPGGSINVHETEQVGSLLFGGLSAFKEAGEVFTTASFDRLIFDKRPTISTGLSIAGNLIQLNVKSNELSADEVSLLLNAYKQKKHYNRLKSGAYLNIAELDQDQLKRIANAFDDLDLKPKSITEAPIELPIYEAFYLDAQLNNANSDGSLESYIRNFETAREKHYNVPAGLSSVLRPYQTEGYSWLSLIADCGFGGILADEMGLGKSVQLISWLLANKDELTKAPALIVCPASLIYNWLAEFAKFAPNLRVTSVDGTKNGRASVRARHDEYDVMIASYDIVRIDASGFAELETFACVLDEAQFIKNRTTKAARAVKKVPAKHRFALTGTPIENKPSELWSIFDFLMPGLLGSPMRFRENFEIPVLGGDAQATERLRSLVGPFIMRRTKKEVLTDLPEKFESVVYTRLDGEQRRLYDANEQHLRDRLNLQKKTSAARGSMRYKPVSAEAAAKYAAKMKSKRPVLRDVATDVIDPADMSKVEVLAEITRLRQLCLDPGLIYENYTGSAAKLDVIIELVQQGIDSGLKMLVFSQFTSFLAEIQKKLAACGIKFYKLTGQTPAKRRLEMVDAFNADDTPVFLISMKAGGTGLNLTGASFVILADPWWNAAVQEQASDRAHRIGQTKDVNVVKIVAKDTIEERIVALQESKRELASSLIGGGSTNLASMTADDLIDLLS